MGKLKTIGEKINLKKKTPKLIPVEEHTRFEDKRGTELQYNARTPPGDDDDEWYR